MTETIAQTLERKYEGKFSPYFNLMDFIPGHIRKWLRRTAYAMAVDYIRPEKGLDPNELYLFEDDSVLEIANPTQQMYQMHVRPKKLKEGQDFRKDWYYI